MRFPALVICLLLVLNTTAQETFVKTYDFGATAAIKQLLQSPAGGNLMIVSKYIRNEKGLLKYSAYAGKLTASGEPLWARSYYTNLSFQIQTSVATADGGFVLFGTLYNAATNTNKGGLAIKCNKQGDIVWSKQVVSKTYAVFEPHLVKEDDEGNIILLYTVANDYYSTDILQAVILSKEGELSWFTTIYTNGPGIGSFYYPAAVVWDKNDIYIAGNLNCQTCEGVITGNLMHIKNTNGVISFKKFVAQPGNRYHNTNAISLYLKNNKAYILGSYTSDYNNKNNYYVLPVTDSNKLTYTILLKPNLFSLQHFLNRNKAVLPLQFDIYNIFKKNGSLIKGYTGYGVSYLMQYDSLGRICPDFIKPVIDTVTSKTIFSVEDKDYEMIKDSVYLRDIAVQDSALSLPYSTTCNGTAPVANRAITTKAADTHSKINLQLYPNPATDILQIAGLKDAATLTIINTLGVIVKRTAVHTVSGTINVKELPAGTYFLQVQYKSSTITKPFIKE